MTGLVEDFIPLDRTFRELEFESNADDDTEMTQFWDHRNAFHWSDLLTEHRVILLSEAGSGKTAEIRNIVRTLREQGKPAFFLRIENIQHNLDVAFEEGTHEEFLAWVQSGEQGWLLLDSVDEARLRHPRDFELAIKILGHQLKPILHQAHILITGRTTAWRAKTDLLLCCKSLPYQSAMKSANAQLEADDEQIASELEMPQENAAAPFKIFALEDLQGDQIDAFLRAKSVKDSKEFLAQVDQKEAFSLTTRPLDLAELIDFWNAHQRIGSRYELMLNSIDRRLKEHSQDRSDVHPMTAKQLRQGAQLVAAATTLCQHSSIQIPDGSNNDKGIAIRDVLTDWNDTDCKVLLSRPIFDGGIYGTVRFHHRSVREFLTAEWLHELINQDGSREQIERLFFRRQYDIEVVVPTMRPVLSWLAILDHRILARACRLAPEVLFEGGDPSQLPLQTRSEILRQACEQLAQPAHGRTLTDFSAVKRFAAPDLTDDINALLIRYGEDENITWFLLLMVWHGHITGAAAQAKHFALHSRAKYTRIAAFRAVAAVGEYQDQNEVLSAFLEESEELSREWLAELILWLPSDNNSAAWLLKAIERTPPEQRFHVDSLTRALSSHLSNWPVSLLPSLIVGFNDLMKTPPVKEMFPSSLSLRYGWLAKPAAQVALTVIEAQDMSAVVPALLSLLRQLPVVQQYGEQDFREIEKLLHSRIADWPEFNHALFWHDAGQTREELFTRSESQQRLFSSSQMGVFGHFWSMNADSFERVCDDITDRELLDDKLIALTLAFSLYRDNERPEAWLTRIKEQSHQADELGTMLGNLLNPPADERQEWKRQEARWRKKAERHAALQDGRKRQWKEHLEADVELLRTPIKRGELSNHQYYLLERLREIPHTSDLWSEGNWKALIPEFGERIATAFRDGAVSFWRLYSPLLRSEGAPANSTPHSVIFGLMGLSIEARENPVWLQTLTEAEARRATRFALHELNGFPTWLPILYDAQPHAVIDTIINEIDFELANQDADGTENYVLYDASWSGDWMWNHLAPLLCTRLRSTPKNIGLLRHMVTILQGSSVDDKSLASIAARKAKASKNLITGSMWFAMWTGVDPSNAIATLAARLMELKSDDDKTRFAMSFITALVGSRRERRSARHAYRTVEHMKALFLLMNLYIREQDDIRRENSGVYSPELRDDAQDARRALLTFIYETRGKQAFFALLEISQAHPLESARPWMAFQAQEKATLDAASSPWSPRQVRDFHDRLERTPANHRELWDLAVDRLLALKHDLEEGDGSIASILRPRNQETEIRKFIGNWCRDRAGGRYNIPQEEEFADAKRADLRFHGNGFDGQVPVELKLVDKWTGPRLLERLENQLCGDYMRDWRSDYGIFLLVYHGTEPSKSWVLTNGQIATSFVALVEGLQRNWTLLSPKFPGVEDIKVIGIDLTKRGTNAIPASRKRKK